MWINIKARLPKINERVLIYSSDLEQYTGMLNWNKEWQSDSCCDPDIENVTHWMLLPEPPNNKGRICG